MAVDVKQLFNNELAERLAGNPEAKKPPARYGFNITGDGGGQWLVDTTKDTPTVASGSVDGADMTMTMSTADFQAAYESPNMVTSLYFQGKLKTTGDPMLAMKAFTFLKG
ncbi:SCP2 sterol-binding domain-containing protein [Streptomyces sp. enrichment culture]|uniref:SCP2 sterol-binding domain-containing protein n=1 Tax=Streptomyces sp. enrichment culture TaxID=1795815 RepID=UPI003F544548